MTKASVSKRRQKGGDETAVRKRILEAAFAAFMESGYATTSTLEIATRARVSKRELYALVGNKQEMLIACISERAKRVDVPADLPVLRDRKALEQVLTSFGTKLVREVSDPTVIAVFRLAIAEVAGLLWGDLMVSLLLGVAERPNPREIAVRARDAVAAFLQLHPLPKEHAPE